MVRITDHYQRAHTHRRSSHVTIQESLGRRGVRPRRGVDSGRDGGQSPVAGGTDGAGQEPVTDDDSNNWFPHPSPDGRSLVFLSFEKSVTGHPENKDVMLRMMTLSDKKVAVLGRFFGGQGTVNVPCWSPDGRKIAFVTYQLIP